MRGTYTFQVHYKHDGNSGKYDVVNRYGGSTATRKWVMPPVDRDRMRGH